MTAFGYARLRAPSSGLRMIAAVFLAWAMAFSRAAAQNLNWTGNVSTDWNTAANWNGEVVPTSGNDVFLDTDTGNQAVLSSGVVATGNITIGNSTASGANTSLTVQSGGNLTGLTAYLGFSANSSGNMLVTGLGTSFTTNHSTTSGTLHLTNPACLIVGGNGTASLTITNGASVAGINGSTYLGLSNGSAGTLLVTGEGTVIQ